VANYLYEGDAPLAERRAQALAVDQAQLRELLGEAELRELLDRSVLGELEVALQCTDAAHQATSPERLHDLLLRLGDLSQEEVRARVRPLPSGDAAAAAEAWLSLLVRERRAIAVQVAGEERFCAAEDAGRLRDALGVALPAGLPTAFLEPAPRALVDLVSRYARTHGPFSAADVARRFGLGLEAVASALAVLAKEERVLEGQFRPGGEGREWCGAEVLRTLRRRSLAALRKQVEPAEPAALGRLLPAWQGVLAPGGKGAGAPRHGPDAVLDVVEQLQGAAFPASILERDVLRARIAGYAPDDLDTLCAAGEVVWVGMGPLGERDGRIALFLADSLPLLLSARAEAPTGALHDRIREHLQRHGASFFGDVLAAAGGGLARPVLDALWDLAWAGEVTNDTPEALRAFLAAHAPRHQRQVRVSSFRSRRQLPPSAVGRWSRVPLPPRPPSATERTKALAEQLIARHGVLTRDAVVSEEVPGGFAAVYPVLRALEEAGRIRRGYFVAGLGGLQFAHPGALERLRERREAATDEPDGLVLAAADPASPYGAALAWPKTAEGRLARVAGAHVVLVDGALAAFVAGRGRTLLPLLPEDEPARSALARSAARALRQWCEGAGPSALGWAAGEGPALAEGPLAPFLAQAGFVRFGPGFRLTTRQSPEGD
jgi:ATP-dependent Lhr-like helicase